MNRDQLQTIIQYFFDHTKEVLASELPFSDDVRKMCEQNTCGNYGKNWTCPPACGSLDELQLRLAPFNRVRVFYKVYPLEDSFDWEGMVTSAKEFQFRIHDLGKQLSSMAPDFNFIMLGAGACRLCKTCAYQQQEPCKRPDEAIFSVEAFGIDVMKMMAENGMTYNNGKNTVTYIGGLLHHSEFGVTNSTAMAVLD